MHGAFHRTLALFLAPALALLTVTAATHAQSATPDANPDLQSRLDSLEKQNRDLAASLQQLQAIIAKQQTTPPPQSRDLWQAPGDGTALDPADVNEILQKHMPQATEDRADADDGLDKKDVESIVNDWWKAKEKKKKEDDELKKLEDEAAGHEVGKDLAMKVNWNHGLWAETADKAFRVHVGGRAQADAVWMAPDPRLTNPNEPGNIGPADDGWNYRRGRLAVEGTFWEVIGFNTEWDFINTANVNPGTPATPNNVINTPVPTDLWIEINRLPWFGPNWISNLRFGNQKPPISFEHLTSSRFLNFLERSFLFDAWIGGLNNGFVPGVQLWNYSRDERMTWSVGVFKNNQNIYGWNVGGGEYDCSARVTWLPLYEHEGRCLIHLGLGASIRDPDDGRFRQRARTMVRNGPAALHTPLVDTTFITNRQTLIVPEVAMVWGPFSLSAEYFGCWFGNTTYTGAPPTAPRGFPGVNNIGTTFFQGAYVEALYFLTGEHRPYNKFGGSGAAFTRVIPHRPFYFLPGEFGSLFSSGAWQVGARYQWADLETKGIPGAVLQDLTLGLNWFLNPNLKFQWNYTIANRDFTNDNVSGNVQGFGMRVAWDF